MSLCIFCGKRANSEEHVWPQWLLTLIKKWPSKNMRMYSARLNKHGEVDKWQAPHPEIVTNCVCIKCNTGWMSDLEGISAPILTPLIDGTAKTIPLSEQVTITSWIAKCTMVFDAMKSIDSFYDQDERFGFRENQIPPLDYTQFWIGHYSGPNLCAFTIFGSGRNNGAHTPNKNYVQSMIFGRLVIQFLGVKPLTTTNVPRVIGVKARKGPYDRAIVPLLSSEGPIHWPPNHSFDDSSCTFQVFADRFGLRPLE